jgi:hypothetical protein
MSNTVWVGLIDVQPGIDGTGGAYAYCAGRGATVTDAVAAVGAEAAERGFEIVAIDWLSPYSNLPQPQRESQAVTGVLAALGEGHAALDRFHSYPNQDEPDAADALKQRVLAFVEGWVDGALESCEPFELGDLAFIAEMQFPHDDAHELGWAYDGQLQHATALFSRAAEAAKHED